MSKESAMTALTGQGAPTVSSLASGVVDPAGASAPAAPSKSESDRFAHLAKREALLVNRDRELKDREAKAKDLLAKGDLFEETRKKDPIAALKLIGFTETDILNYLAEQDVKPDPTSEEKAAAAAKKATEDTLKAYQDGEAKKQAEAQKAKDDQSIKDFRGDMSKAIEANKEKYEFCALYPEAAEDLAFTFISQVIIDSKGKDIPTIKEALEVTEQYYIDDDNKRKGLKSRQPKEEAFDMAKNETRTSKVTPGHPNAPQPKPNIQGTRTLSNNSGPTMASSAGKKESPSEKRARLENVLRNMKSS